MTRQRARNNSKIVLRIGVCESLEKVSHNQYAPVGGHPTDMSTECTLMP